MTSGKGAGRSGRNAGSARGAQKDGQSLVEIATNRIRDRILDLSLSPGFQLNETFLRDRLGISRTPAREALSRLVTEGLVESHSARGFFVRQLDLRETAHFFDTYLLVERSCATLCRFGNEDFAEDMRSIQDSHTGSVRSNQFLEITKFNSDFHLRIAAATENRFLEDFAIRTHNFARRLAYYIYAYESDDREYFEEQQEKILQEHESIVTHIENRDRESVVELITLHADRLRQRMAKSVQGHPTFELAGITRISETRTDLG